MSKLKILRIVLVLYLLLMLIVYIVAKNRDYIKVMNFILFALVMYGYKLQQNEKEN